MANNAITIAGVDFANPMEWAILYDDFLGNHEMGTTVGAAAILGGWDLEFLGSGDLDGSYDRLVNSAGLLELVTEGGDNEAIALHPIQDSWGLDLDQRMFMEFRFRITAGTIASNEFAIGLGTFAAGSPNDFIAAAGNSFDCNDFWGFHSIDAVAVLTAEQAQNDARTTGTAITLMETATFYTISMYYDGATTRWYVGGALGGSLGSANVPLSSTDNLTPIIWFKAGTAEVQTLDLDYVLWAKQCTRNDSNNPG